MTSDWREDLRHLDGFPLIPCGAGEKGKAPIHPKNALPLRDWQKAAFTPDQINEMPAHVICVGTRTGPEAGNLLIIDIDGESALNYCNKVGCLLNDSSWTIRRDTDPSRLKVAFRIKDCELSEQLFAFGKIVFSTSENPKEQVELFYGSGQCIVLGQHKDSGGNYTWCGKPNNLLEPSEAWDNLIRDVIKTKQKNYFKKASSDQWQDCIPCPICGRTEPDCRILEDGSFIQCHKGSRWNPPSLSRGQIITVEGVDWAYVGDSKNAIGPCSNFKINEDKNKDSNDSDLVLLEGLEIRRARGGGANVGKVDWVIEGFAAVGIVLLAAEPGTGKTTFLYRAADAIQEGRDFLDAVPVQKASVLVIQGDEPQNVVDRKIARMDLVGNFAILYDSHLLKISALRAMVCSGKWRAIIVDSLTTVLSSSNCTTMDLSMAALLYELNKLASEHKVAIIMTAHLNKPSRDGSGKPMPRKVITWSDISGVATISAAVNDAWGLTAKDDNYSLHALGKRHIEAYTEWVLQRSAEDFWWGLKEVRDGLMPRDALNAKAQLLSYFQENKGQFLTAKEVSSLTGPRNIEHARRCLCELFDTKQIMRRKRRVATGRPLHEYGLNQ